MIRRIRAFIIAIVVAAASIGFSTDMNSVYAEAAVPQKVIIGLSFGQNATNLFKLSSETGIVLTKTEGGNTVTVLNFDAPGGITVRRDAYYNIVKGIITAVNFNKATKYEGEVIGPYHIQVGDTYPDMETAKKVAGQVASSAPAAFIAYEDGWRVWAQLFLDEGECSKQIELLSNELKDFAFSVVRPDRKRIHILDAVTGQILLAVNSETPVIVNGKAAQNSDCTIQYGSTKYRGTIILQSQQDSDISVVNEVPFEQYLYGVVPSEMPSSWHPEALKAQAVAARNYALVSMGKHKGQGFDLCNSDHCQVYKGFSNEKKSTNDAVAATAGKLLYYKDKLVSTIYHSSSGGHTENSENIWYDTLPYIRAVDDRFGLGSPYDHWSNQINRAGIREKMTQANLGVGDILDVVPIQTSQYGRVQKVEIKGTEGSKVLEKEKIRWVLSNAVLKSIWYQVKTDADVFIRSSMDAAPSLKRPSGMYVAGAKGTVKLSSPVNKLFVKNYTNTAAYNIIPDVYTFSGKGWGHGLGMSQYGAKGMAEAGYNYAQILEYYYKDTKVK